MNRLNAVDNHVLTNLDDKMYREYNNTSDSKLTNEEPSYGYLQIATF